MVSQKLSGGATAPTREYSSHPLALLLAGISGILHVYVGYVVDGLPNGAVLILIAVVYFVGIALVAANYKRDFLFRIGPLWVGVLLVLWAVAAVMNLAGSGARDPAAYAIKVDEVVLLSVLFQVRRLTLSR